MLGNNLTIIAALFSEDISTYVICCRILDHSRLMLSKPVIRTETEVNAILGDMRKTMRQSAGHKSNKSTYVQL